MVHKDTKYFRQQILTDSSGHPCARELLKIIGFNEVSKENIKLPKAVFKLVPGAPQNKSMWRSDKYASPVVAMLNFYGMEHGYFWIASKSDDAIRQVRETAKQAVSIYLEHYSKEWVQVAKRSAERIDFDLVKKQTMQDLENKLPA